MDIRDREGRARGLEIHELRHTAASLMIDQGADPKLIQSQLGHSSISITYDVYGHLFPDRLDELAAKLDQLIDRDGQDGTVTGVWVTRSDLQRIATLRA